MLARSAAELEGAWNLRRDLQSCLGCKIISLSPVAKSLGQPPSFHYKIHPGEWASSNRSTRLQEVVLARLRMGCILAIHMLPYIGHAFPTQCITCHTTLSIDHILLYCVRYREARRSLAAFCEARRLPMTQTSIRVTSIRMWSIV